MANQTVLQPFWNRFSKFGESIAGFILIDTLTIQKRFILLQNRFIEFAMSFFKCMPPRK